MKIKVLNQFNILGRGEVFIMSLKENGFNGLRSEFSKLMKQEIEVAGKKYFVKGIEAFATPEDYIHDKIGLLVK